MSDRHERRSVKEPTWPILGRRVLWGLDTVHDRRKIRQTLNEAFRNSAFELQDPASWIVTQMNRRKVWHAVMGLHNENKSKKKKLAPEDTGSLLLDFILKGYQEKYGNPDMEVQVIGIDTLSTERYSTFSSVLVAKLDDSSSAVIAKEQDILFTGVEELTSVKMLRNEVPGHITSGRFKDKQLMPTTEMIRSVEPVVVGKYVLGPLAVIYN